MPIILTLIDRLGSLMVAEYTLVPGKKDHWDCAMLQNLARQDETTSADEGGCDVAKQEGTEGCRLV
jgi:hypothetical protein